MNGAIWECRICHKKFHSLGEVLECFKEHDYEWVKARDEQRKKSNL